MLDKEAQKKRDHVQKYFWDIVGSAEHINLPKLEDALKKQFPNQNDRFIQEQISLMQTESRIKIQSKSKVWIKQPTTKQ
jgi:hypothetical protein